MQKITREEILKAFDEDLAAKLTEEVPTEVERAVKKFLDGFDRDYRARIKSRRHQQVGKEP